LGGIFLAVVGAGEDIGAGWQDDGVSANFGFAFSWFSPGPFIGIGGDDGFTQRTQAVVAFLDVFEAIDFYLDCPKSTTGPSQMRGSTNNQLARNTEKDNLVTEFTKSFIVTLLHQRLGQVPEPGRTGRSSLFVFKVLSLVIVVGLISQPERASMVRTPSISKSISKFD
jgi:hypothetical protein